MDALITQLEELSVNAWAPLQSMVYDGWMIRMADGYTLRANAIHPLYGGVEALLKKIEFCERLYRSKGLSIVYKLTSASQPHGLDAALLEQGYAFEPEVSVQTLGLNIFSAEKSADVKIEPSPSAQWLDAFQRMQNLNAAKRRTLALMLENIIPDRAFVSLIEDGETIACGLGVHQGDFVGLFDIITDARFRQRGYGRKIVQRLLGWAQDLGAQTAYLQVTIDNVPALGLYENLGFKEVYRYWYRVKE